MPGEDSFRRRIGLRPPAIPAGYEDMVPKRAPSNMTEVAKRHGLTEPVIPAEYANMRPRRVSNHGLVEPQIPTGYEDVVPKRASDKSGVDSQGVETESLVKMSDLVNFTQSETFEDILSQLKNVGAQGMETDGGGFTTGNEQIHIISEALRTLLNDGGSSGLIKNLGPNMLNGMLGRLNITRTAGLRDALVRFLKEGSITETPQ